MNSSFVFSPSSLDAQPASLDTHYVTTKTEYKRGTTFNFPIAPLFIPEVVYLPCLLSREKIKIYDFIF